MREGKHAGAKPLQGLPFDFGGVCAGRRFELGRLLQPGERLADHPLVARRRETRGGLAHGLVRGAELRQSRLGQAKQRAQLLAVEPRCMHALVEGLLDIVGADHGLCHLFGSDPDKAFADRPVMSRPAITHVALSGGGRSAETCCPYYKRGWRGKFRLRENPQAACRRRANRPSSVTSSKSKIATITTRMTTPMPTPR